jgi:hypothetical protein
MAGIPRITRRTKAPAPPSATEIMAEPVHEWFDPNDDGEICDASASPPAYIFPEPVYDPIDVDDDDDYPDPAVSGDAGYTSAPDDDDDRPILTAPIAAPARPPTT